MTTLSDCLFELYAATNGEDDPPFVVILSSVEKSSDVNRFLAGPRYKSMLIGYDKLD